MTVGAAVIMGDIATDIKQSSEEPTNMNTDTEAEKANVTSASDHAASTSTSSSIVTKNDVPTPHSELQVKVESEIPEPHLQIEQILEPLQVSSVT